jgi:dihydropteroate synthase
MGPDGSAAIAATPRVFWKLRSRKLGFPRPLAVGIVNVTDDSFYSGARSGTAARAVEDGLRLAREGFDLIDVGAVAARSGPPVPPAREAARLVPAIEGLVAERAVPVTADTFSPAVARRALRAGAEAINDIGGGLEPEMLEVAAETGCGLVLMHIEGPPREDRAPPSYADPVEHLAEWFAGRIEAARAAGVGEDQIALDPRLDFDLSVDDDLAILRHLERLRELRRPLFVSLSRKDFLGAVLAGSWKDRLPPERREWATAAAAALAVAHGAHLLRLHDPSALDAVRVADRIANG